VKLFLRNHSEPATVNSSGTPFYSGVSVPVSRNSAHLSYLVICRTNISESLIPQLHVSRDLSGHGCEKLRRGRRIGLDHAICVVVPEHLTVAGERKGLNGNVGLV
jgi:hypothetical protein